VSKVLCQWATCRETLGDLAGPAAEQHLMQHVKKKSRCRWDRCVMGLETKEGLLQHLWSCHKVPVTNDFLDKAQYCLECAEYFLSKVCNVESKIGIGS